MGIAIQIALLLMMAAAWRGSSFAKPDADVKPLVKKECFKSFLMEFLASCSCWIVGAV